MGPRRIVRETGRSARSHRSSNLCDGAVVGGSGNWITGSRFEATGDPCSEVASPSGQPAARLHRCASAPCRCVALSNGKPGGGAKPAVREPRAVRSACSTRATESERDGFMARATRAWGRFFVRETGGKIGFKVWATRAVRFVRFRGQPRERTSGMASGSMNGAREVVRETGRQRALRGSGNRNAEAFTAKETLPVNAGADRLGARATGLERRAHDKLTARATGA